MIEYEPESTLIEYVFVKVSLLREAPSICKMYHGLAGETCIGRALTCTVE